MAIALFSKRSCARILRKAGAIQISDEADDELQKAVEKYAMEVSKNAVLFADDYARRRVLAKDVRAAIEEFLQSGD